MGGKTLSQCGASCSGSFLCNSFVFQASVGGCYLKKATLTVSSSSRTDSEYHSYYCATPTKAPTKAPTTKAPTTKSIAFKNKKVLNARSREAVDLEQARGRRALFKAPTTKAPTTNAPPTQAPTTKAPTTKAPTTKAPTTKAPTAPAPAPSTNCTTLLSNGSATGEISYPNLMAGTNATFTFTTYSDSSHTFPAYVVRLLCAQARHESVCRGLPTSIRCASAQGALTPPAARRTRASGSPTHRMRATDRVNVWCMRGARHTES